MESIANLIRKIAEDDVPTFKEKDVENKLKKTLGKYSDRRVSDNAWQAIQALQNDLYKTEILPKRTLSNLTQVEDQYHGEFPHDRKTWLLAGGFIDQKNKKRAVWIQISANGIGSTKEPLDKYEIGTQIQILAPQNTKGKVREHLDNVFKDI